MGQAAADHLKRTGRRSVPINVIAAIFRAKVRRAILGQRDEALSLLREAVDHGLRVEDDLGLDKDPDLQSPHADPRFAALVAHAKERAAPTQKPH